MNRILVADDNKLIRWSLREIFSNEGYKVDTAASSLEAIKQAESVLYSLIVTDFEIDDENCIHTIRTVKSFQPSTKVIILSALPPQKIESKLEGLDIYAIIEKPFHSKHILSITKEAMG